MEKGSIDFEDKNLVTVSSLKEALATINDEQVYIAGGYRLFKEALPLVDIMYITEIDMIIEPGERYELYK